MRALVLTHDRCRLVAEHVLRTYAEHWPRNTLLFRIPYQSDTRMNTHGQRIEWVRADKGGMTRGIKAIVTELLDGLPDEEWIYWCIDDKFVIAMEPDDASYLLN